ncbi:MAG TPA: hypothetical protein VG247_11430 [Pseudonocardiaceae bacterium]|nr:hypothetical protein [Pseudonocardiaceae bacterium]
MEEAGGESSLVVEELVVVKNWAFVIVGAVLFLVGLVWTLQGLDIVKGSFMSGAKLWLAIGLLVGIGGIFLVSSGIRRLRAHA